MIGGVAAIARQCACHRLFMRPLESCLDMRPTPVQARARRCRLRLAAVAGPMVTTLAITAAGCASANGAPTPNEVDAAIRARTAEAGIRIEAQAPLPPDVDPTDGVTQEEAVARIAQEGDRRSVTFRSTWPSVRESPWTAVFPEIVDAMMRAKESPSDNLRQMPPPPSSSTPEVELLPMN